MKIRRGNGWTALDLGGHDQGPGGHDVGAPLGMTPGAAVIVVLRAAEEWTPDANAPLRRATFVRRQGRVQLELGDASTHVLDSDNEVLQAELPVRSLINLDDTRAEVLAIVHSRRRQCLGQSTD